MPIPILLLSAWLSLAADGAAPLDAEGHYTRGVALLQAGDAVRASEELSRADSLAPGRAEILAALGCAMNLREQHGLAVVSLGHSLERDPGNPDVLAALAEAEESTGRSALAEQHARRALQISTRHANALLVLGTILVRDERFDEARVVLSRAVAADPASPKAHYQLSLALARLGDEAASERERKAYEEALRAFERQAPPILGRAHPERASVSCIGRVP